MKMVTKTVFNELTVNKSKFICFIYNIEKASQVKELLNNLKSDYKGADHYCYAYICNNKMQASDDSEPSNTAGYPILNVLLQNNLTNVLCVVIRYFGGIKLGTGGLIRAYSKSVKSALLKANIINLVNNTVFQIKFSYNNIKKIDNILINTTINNKQFNDDITYEFILEDDKKEEILSKLKLNIMEIMEIKRNIFY